MGWIGRSEEVGCREGDGEGCGVSYVGGGTYSGEEPRSVVGGAVGEMGLLRSAGRTAQSALALLSMPIDQPMLG